MNRSELRIDWATHESAKYACLHWHYSRTIPVGKMVKIGAWEHGKFIGVVIFAWGMNRNLGSPYGLGITECCELVRVALTTHQTPVSRIISIALKFLKRNNPGIRLVVSFADPEENHHGGIYQAGNWIYAGKSTDGFEWRLNGKRLNKRAYTGNNFGKDKLEVPKGAKKVAIQGKHRYIMSLDDSMKAKIEYLRKPYPKRVESADSGTLDSQSRGDRANRISTL